MKLLKWLKDRWQDRVRPHLSSERVSAACDLMIIAGAVWKFLS